MSPMRMRVMLLVPLLLVSVGLTAASLLVVRSRMQKQIADTLASDLTHSVATFQNLQHQRREMLFREAALLADLPSLKALMTTRDQRTIEDGGQEFWKVSGTDLFALTASDGKVLALYSGSHGSASDAIGLPFAQNRMRQLLQIYLRRENMPRFVLLDGRLYEFSFEPLYFGSHVGGQLLGYVVIGYAIDQNLARQVSEAAAAEVAFLSEGVVAASTLNPRHQQQLQTNAQTLLHAPMQAADLWLNDEHFTAVALELSPGGPDGVQLVVLKSFAQQDQLSRRLNRLFATLGAIALLVGGLLSLWISKTVTHPLEALASGVRALGTGDYDYRLPQTGAQEVRELSSAFGRMRDEMRSAQRELIESERLATIGRMASSVSHDLRHYLAAVYANAEFLSTANSDEEKADLLSDIRLAVNGMTDLIESLLMFSRTGRALQLTHESLLLLVEKAVALLSNHPEAAGIRIQVEARSGEEFDAWADARKMQRAIYNLALNACQAARHSSMPPGCVTISLSQTEDKIQIQVIDNGPGIAPAIRANLFEPFVSEGKEGGVGLGLTLAHRIADEHGGAVTLEHSGPEGTSFLLTIKKAAPGTPAIHTSFVRESHVGTLNG